MTEAGVISFDSVPGHHHSKQLKRSHHLFPAHDSLHLLGQKLSGVPQQRFQELALGFQLRFLIRLHHAAPSLSRDLLTQDARHGFGIALQASPAQMPATLTGRRLFARVD